MTIEATAHEQAVEQAWPRIEIAATDLAYALRAVLPHTANDALRPHAGMIRIQFRPIDNAFTFTATDSYTLAESSVTAGLELEEIEALTARFDVWEVCISAVDAKRILNRAKTEKTAKITLVLASDPHSVLDIVWEWGAVTERVLNQGVHYEFPKMAHLWPSAVVEHGPVRFGLNGDHFARFKASTLARGKSDTGVPVTLQFSDEAGRKPILVTFSDHFRGLLMPMRLNS